MRIKKLELWMSPVICLIVMFACGDNTSADDGNSGDPEDKAVEYDISVNYVLSDEVPLECEAVDAYLDCHQWTDVNGKNYFLRSLGIPFKSEVLDEKGDSTESQFIHAYHYVENSSGIELVKEYRDSVFDCEYYSIMNFVIGCYFVSDIDKDKMGEITYMYDMRCTPEIEPSNRVLMMIEGNNVYTIRGKSLAKNEVGEYVLGPEFANAPAGFSEHAKGIWEDYR
ncbi:hypothetical protein JYT21_00035 [bacterium AH-315-B15]|nr:hypothetical protein [bacterium AH-315-B15]